MGDEEGLQRVTWPAGDFDATMNCKQNCLDDIGPNSSIIVNRRKSHIHR